MKTWVIYKHTNKKSGKSYIGLTCRGMDVRWNEHLTSARTGSPYHFHNAIRKYGEDTWSHKIVADGIKSFKEAQKTERDFIRKYDSLDNGYNMTIGGEWLEDYVSKIKKFEVPRLGEKKKEVEVKIPKKRVYRTFRFVHRKHGVVFMTVRELRLKYRLKKSSVLALVRGERERVMGWKI